METNERKKQAKQQRRATNAAADDVMMRSSAQHPATDCFPIVQYILSFLGVTSKKYEFTLQREEQENSGRLPNGAIISRASETELQMHRLQLSRNYAHIHSGMIIFVNIHQCVTICVTA